MDVTITNNAVNGNSNSATPGIAFVGGISITSFDDSAGDILRFTLRGNSVTGTNANPTQCGGAQCVDYYLERVGSGGTVLMEEVPNTADTNATVGFVRATNSPNTATVTIFGTIPLSNGAVSTIIP